MDRRQFVRGIGAVTITAGLAGCSGGGDDGGGDGNGGDGGDGGNGPPAAVEEWLSDANEYDGTVTDKTGSDSVTVEVGAGDGLAFVPAAVRISTGTEVTWEWTGEGGRHNVVAESGGDFESELTQEEGFTFSQTFEESGVVTYYCNPHRGVGMKGALVVE